MSNRCTLSPRAQIDIDEIWGYSVARWGIDQAELYIQQMRRHIEAIATKPELGRACPEIRSGYRKYRAGSHVLFFRRIGDDVNIVRILQESMDFDRHL